MKSGKLFQKNYEWYSNSESGMNDNLVTTDSV